jgi:small subunit ribosomal protein S2
MSTKVTLEDLIKSGAHLGHQTKRWNPKMKPYIYGEREGVHIFDLEKTKELLEEALAKIKETAKEGKILLLGTKKQAKEKTREIAESAGIYWVTERWLGGTLTNFEQIKKSARKLVDMRTKLANGDYKDRTKKERLLIQREIDRLDRFFGGVVGMDDIPDLLIIIDTKRERSAVREAKAQGVETVGLVDTNSDPMEVDYPIPMNDDATRALDYVLNLFGEAVIEGRKPAVAKKSVLSKPKTVKKKSSKKPEAKKRKPKK